MEIGWPEGIWIAYALMVLTGSAFLHGQPKVPFPEKWSFPVSLMSFALSSLLLWWGGFFAPSN